jgi:hypothetical protein
MRRRNKGMGWVEEEREKGKREKKLAEAKETNELWELG